MSRFVPRRTTDPHWVLPQCFRGGLAYKAGTWVCKRMNDGLHLRSIIDLFYMMLETNSSVTSKLQILENSHFVNISMTLVSTQVP